MNMNQIFEIIVSGDLDPHWSQWFDGLVFTHTPQGETKIRGPMRDQAELFGVLIRLRDLGITLISVRRVDREE
jgi:hypothetical protein